MSRFAKLTDSQMAEISKLEERWKNVVLLAYEKPLKLANPSQEQMKKIQKLEKELGVILVAYEL